MARTNASWAIAALLFLGGCNARIWYTQPLRDAFEGGHGGPPAERGGRAVTPADLQYFISSRLVLERRIHSHRERVAGGRVFQRRGEWIERIVIRRGTPGVADRWGAGWVAVSFESGASLVFEVDPTKPLDADREPANLVGEQPPSETYRLRTSRDSRGDAHVLYRGYDYVIANASAGVRLEIRRHSQRDWSWRRRVLPGRRL